MMRPAPAVAAHRRRALVWAPLVVTLGAIYLMTFHLMNGATVLAAGLMLAAALGAVLDDGSKNE
ncbi:hypothetical protein [Zhihengliuella halotolerans]|uniref:Uncharacterized protein n=1 Tax=Zhihengliuella halotolerans TaxID=370736 RepID=A0A4Q8ADM5_9MICC|nr:hypothetical protein [Zhihengliuella halotolerans]RZU61765.1 hypothetical protein EV380_1343 [Zhihengliuella halotolerans]